MPFPDDPLDLQWFIDSRPVTWSKYFLLYQIVLNLSILRNDGSDGYVWASGTSMAAPHVAAAAGLILGLQPDWTYQQIKARLLSST